MNISRHLKVSVGMVLLALAQQAAASGYHFGTQSVNAQSTANAAAAEAADATTLFYNPAGLTKLDSNQISATVNLVLPHIKYSNAQATYRGGSAVRGSTSGKITDTAVPAPHVYGAYKLNDRITLGLGMYIPFASSTEYEKDSVLRHHLNQLGLTSIAFEPVVAFKANDQHSFGAGVIAQYSKAELRKFADWNASGTFNPLISKMTSGAVTNASGWVDGHAKVKGDDWGFGYHLAWMFDVNDRFRMGVNYRSKIEHNLKGDAEWDVSTALQVAQPTIRGLGYVAKEGASVKIVTPESLSLHGMYRANDKLNLFGDITWTRHSRFNQATLYFENQKTIGRSSTGPVRSNRTVITPNWRNTVKVALGASYQVSEPLQLRAGIAFDQSPIRSADDRLNTLPDGNRIWFSVGAKYAFNKNHIIDVAYSHIHINDTSFKGKASDGTTVDSKGAASANFKNYANILGVQYTYKF